MAESATARVPGPRRLRHLQTAGGHRLPNRLRRGCFGRIGCGGQFLCMGMRWVRKRNNSLITSPTPPTTQPNPPTHPHQTNHHTPPPHPPPQRPHTSKIPHCGVCTERSQLDKCIFPRDPYIFLFSPGRSPSQRFFSESHPRVSVVQLNEEEEGLRAYMDPPRGSPAGSPGGIPWGYHMGIFQGIPLGIPRGIHRETRFPG